MSNSVHPLPTVTADHLKALQLWEASGAAEAMREQVAKQQRDKQAELLGQIAAIESERATKLPPLWKALSDAEAALTPLLREVQAKQLAYRTADYERFIFENSTDMRLDRLRNQVRDLAPTELGEAIFVFRRLQAECIGGELFVEKVEIKRSLLRSVEEPTNNALALAARYKAIGEAIRRIEEAQLDPEMNPQKARELIKSLRDALPASDRFGTV